MSKRLIFAATLALALNSLMVTSVIGANMETTSVSNDPSNANDKVTEMNKDAWLKAMEPMLPGLICKGFMKDVDLKKRFDALKITYDQCVSLVPESEKKCQDQIYASLPAKINKESASIWGKTLGECIGKDFAEKHLIPQS